MKKAFFPLVMVVVLALVACASPTADSINQPSADQVATVVAMTLQALASEVADTPTSEPERSTSLLPHTYTILVTMVYPISHRSIAWNATVKQ